MDPSQPQKKNNNTLIIIIIIILIVAGVAGYVLYEKGQQDMANKVRMEQIQHQMNERNKKRIVDLKNIIAHKKAELQMASNKLTSINGYQFLRTADEKQQQLANQNKIIDQIKEDLRKLQQELTSLQQVTY